MIWVRDDKSYLVKVERGKSFSTLKGVVKFDQIIGKKYGQVIKTSMNLPVFIFQPSLGQRILKLKRRTQIIYPKDIGYALTLIGVTDGWRIIEAGCGSGAMTIALANAVKPTGKVYSYDIRDDFITLAKSNLNKIGLLEFVEFTKKDLTEEEFDQKDVDAVFIDLPSPWVCIKSAKASLKPGGFLFSISPTYNQVERFVKDLKDNGFEMIKTVEILEREILAREGKTRPKERMISHTGFLTFARATIE